MRSERYSALREEYSWQIKIQISRKLLKMVPNGSTCMADETKIANDDDRVEPGNEEYDEDTVKKDKMTTDLNYKHELLPKFAIALAILHIGALYGLYLIVTFRLKLMTFIWGCIVGLASAEGIAIGAHRGFSHNSFKLNTLGQVLFIILQTVSGQYHIHWWVRDHRLHHKFVDTDADPYNAKRGFFFSHIGWMMMKKHPLVTEKGAAINMSDIESNKLIMFQKKYFIPMFFLFNIIIPVTVPVYFWNENIWISFFTMFVYRYVHLLNATWCINSIAHMYGTRPFDMRTTAHQSQFTHIVTFGEGWHNYHHIFPWDHGMDEFGFTTGISTRVLRFLARIGVAYDLRKPSPELIYKHSQRHGDGTITPEDCGIKTK